MKTAVYEVPCWLVWMDLGHHVYISVLGTSEFMCSFIHIFISKDLHMYIVGLVGLAQGLTGDFRSHLIIQADSSKLAQLGSK